MHADLWTVLNWFLNILKEMGIPVGAQECKYLLIDIISLFECQPSDLCDEFRNENLCVTNFANQSASFAFRLTLNLRVKSMSKSTSNGRHKVNMFFQFDCSYLCQILTQKIRIFPIYP